MSQCSPECELIVAAVLSVSIRETGGCGGRSHRRVMLRGGALAQQPALPTVRHSPGGKSCTM